MIVEKIQVFIKRSETFVHLCNFSRNYVTFNSLKQILSVPVMYFIFIPIQDGTTFDYNHGGYGEQYEYNHGGQFYDQVCQSDNYGEGGTNYCQVSIN